MWKAYLKLKTTHRLPSEDLDEQDSLAAWCVDDAVMWFGLTVENTLVERVNTGTEKEPKWEAKYTLAELLDPLFRVPTPQPVVPRKPVNGLAALMALAGKKGSGVKLWRAIEPS